MKQTINKLSPSIVKKAYSKEFTQKQITVEVDGKNYVINCDTKFKATKMQSLIMELAEVTKNLIGYEQLISLPQMYMLLCIKYFSDLQVETNTFEENIAYFNMLFDLGIANKIIESFDKEELEKVNQFIEKANQNIKELKNNPKAYEAMGELFKDIDEKFGDDLAVEEIESEDNAESEIMPTVE